MYIKHRLVKFYVNLMPVFLDELHVFCENNIRTAGGYLTSGRLDCGR